MRGDSYLSLAPAAAPDEPVQASTAEGPAAGVSNIEKNMELAKKPGSIWWLILMLGLYAIYYVLYNRRLKEAIDTDALLAFIHQAFSVTILVVVGVNLANVLLTKLAAMRIPLISKVAGTYLPLFHL